MVTDARLTCPLMMPDGASIHRQRLTYAGDVTNMAALGVVRKQKNLGEGGKQSQPKQQKQQQKAINERWVMLNKERFHEIFNETLLHEMTLTDPPPPEVITPEVMPLNLVMSSDERCREKCEQDKHKDTTSACSADTIQYNTSGTSADKTQYKTGSSSTDAMQYNSGDSSVQIHAGDSSSDSIPYNASGSNVDTIQYKTVGNANTVQYEMGSSSVETPAERHRDTPPMDSSSRDQKNRKKRDKTEKKDNKKLDKSEVSKSRACPVAGEDRVSEQTNDKQVTSAVAVSSTAVVFSELLKNRPLVSAALFGNQSAGSRTGSETEVIHVASREEEEEVIDPVGSGPSSPQHQPYLQPPLPDITSSPSGLAHLPPPTSTTPPPLQPLSPQSIPAPAARACGGEVCSAASVQQHSQPSDNNKNTSAVSECINQQQQQEKEPAVSAPEYVELSEEEDLTSDTNMNRSGVEIQRHNWVSVNKSTLYNLVDELVGSRLGSSGEDEETKDTAPPPRCSISSLTRQSRTYNNNKDTTPSPKVPLSPLLKRMPPPVAAVPSGGASLGPIPCMSAATASLVPLSGSKQVLKQCWVALNKTVVFDMVEQAMAGEKTEATTVTDLSLPKLNPTYCDRDCSENYIDSGCTIHKQPTAKTEQSKKRPTESTDETVSLKRKRPNVNSRGNMSSSTPQRPASAPVERSSSPHHSPTVSRRAPSPYSQEFHVLQREHASQCDKLMSAARQQARVHVSQGSPSSSAPSAAHVPHTQPPTSSTDTTNRDSPKLGWVAVSKAEVHTIVDSVMSSLLQQEVNEGSDKAALVRGSSPPPPSPSPSPPVLQQQQPAPHRPWLVDSSSQSKHTSTSSHESCMDSASSPSSMASPVSSASSPSHDTHAKAPFKWKSSLLARAQCQGSPGEPLRESPEPEENAPLDMSAASSSSSSSNDSSSTATTTTSNNRKTTSSQRRKGRAHKTK